MRRELLPLCLAKPKYNAEIILKIRELVYLGTHTLYYLLVLGKCAKKSDTVAYLCELYFY